MKKWYTSKTIIFNIIMTVLGILSLTELTQFLDPKIISFIQGIGNVIIRVWLTDTIVSKKLF